MTWQKRPEPKKLLVNLEHKPTGEKLLEFMKEDAVDPKEQK